MMIEELGFTEPQDILRIDGIPVNYVDPNFGSQLVFFSEDEAIEYYRDKGYEITYTFAGKLYAVLDPIDKHLKKKFKRDLLQQLVKRAFKVIETNSNEE